MSDQNSGGGRGPLSQQFPHEPERIRKGAELIAAMRRGEIESPKLRSEVLANQVR